MNWKTLILAIALSLPTMSYADPDCAVPRGKALFFPVVNVDVNEVIEFNLRVVLPQAVSRSEDVVFVANVFDSGEDGSSDIGSFSVDWNARGFGTVTHTLSPLSDNLAQLVVNGTPIGVVALRKGRARYAITGQFDPQSPALAQGGGIPLPAGRLLVSRTVYDQSGENSLYGDFFGLDDIWTECAD